VALPPPGEGEVSRIPALYVICDVDRCLSRHWDPVAFATACLAGGATLIQLRAKTLGGADFLHLIDRVVGLARPLGAAVVVNDRVDLARAAGADGVHVGQGDLSPAAVRAQLGPAAIVGLSTHTREQVIAAGTEPVTYVAVGPVFETATKDTGYQPVGIGLVADAKGLLAPGMSIVAIGGVTLERTGSVMQAGASSVAVVSDLLTADPALRVGEYRARLTEAGW
jgi:thiamine-phosphate pyrophosphorylase